MEDRNRTNIEQFETELFDRYASEYSSKYDYPHCYEVLLYDFKKGVHHLQYSLGTVLEIGCGNGNLYPIIQKMCSKYIGIDFSQNLLALARKHPVRSGDEFKVSNIKDTGIASNSIDTVISYGVLHHTVEHLLILKEMFRVLKPGGHILLYEPSGEALLLEGLRSIRKLIDPKFSPNQVSFTKDELKGLLLEASFSPLCFWYSLYGLGFFADIKYKIFPKPITQLLFKSAKKIDKLFEKSSMKFIKKQAFAINCIGKKPQ